MAQVQYSIGSLKICFVDFECELYIELMQVNYEPRGVHSSMRVTKSLFYMKEICVHSTVQYSTVLYSCILQIKHFMDFYKATHVSVLLDS